MTKIQAKRSVPTISAPSPIRRVNNSATLAPVRAAPLQRRQTKRTAEPAQVVPTTSVPSAAPRRPSKQSMIATMLRQRGGAAIADLMTATGWQSHSIRAALTGLRKAGHQIKRQRDSAGATRYRLVSAA